jgi:hypothetical protein
MRTRALVSLAILSLPAIVSAQITRRPSTRTPIEPAGLPPAVPEVARELAYKRSRWAFEGYSMFSAIQAPSAGGTAMSSVFGAGTHGDYRLTDAIAGTADITYSTFGTSNASYQSAEAGARFMLPGAETRTKPFFDARATYMSLSDLYSASLGSINGASVTPTSRYSRGFGGFAGVGVMHNLFGSFLLTTEIAALRNRMTTYRTTAYSVPTGTSYWATTYRFSVGFRYHAQRTLALSQNPRQ